MSQHYCLYTVWSVVYVDKNTVYSFVFINIITNKSHLQKTELSRRLIFADVIKMLKKQDSRSKLKMDFQFTK